MPICLSLGLRRPCALRAVRAVDAMLTLGADTFIEAGPGKVLSGLVGRCTRGRTPVTVLNVEDPASLEKTLAALNG